MRKDEEKRIDELLRSKLGREDFAFKDEYWQRARKMIDENRPSRSRIYFMILFTGLVMFSCAAFVMNYYAERNQQEARITGTKESKHTAATSVVKAQATPGNYDQAAEGISTNSQGISAHTLIHTQPATEVQTNLISGTTTNTGITSGNSTITSSSSVLNTRQPYRIISAKDHHHSVETNGEHTTLTRQALNVQREMASADLRPARPELISFAAIPTRNIQPISPVLSLDPVVLPARKVLNPNLLNGVFPSFIMFEGGVTYYNPEAEETNNLNFFAGAKFAFFCNDRLSLMGGLGYSRLHQSNGKRTYNKINFGFAEKVQSTGINTIRLDYLEIPLSTYYSFGNRSIVTAGAMLGYLVQSADLVKRPGETSYNEKANGYYGAFKPLDVQLNIGYSYVLTEKVILTAAYHYGVQDITRNQSFRSNAFDRNAGLRLSLGYLIRQ